MKLLRLVLCPALFAALVLSAALCEEAGPGFEPSAYLKAAFPTLNRVLLNPRCPIGDNSGGGQVRSPYVTRNGGEIIWRGRIYSPGSLTETRRLYDLDDLGVTSSEYYDFDADRLYFSDRNGVVFFEGARGGLHDVLNLVDGWKVVQGPQQLLLAAFAPNTGAAIAKFMYASGNTLYFRTVNLENCRIWKADMAAHTIRMVLEGDPNYSGFVNMEYGYDFRRQAILAAEVAVGGNTSTRLYFLDDGARELAIGPMLNRWVRAPACSPEKGLLAFPCRQMGQWSIEVRDARNPLLTSLQNTLVRGEDLHCFFEDSGRLWAWSKVGDKADVSIYRVGLLGNTDSEEQLEFDWARPLAGVFGDKIVMAFDKAWWSVDLPFGVTATVDVFDMAKRSWAHPDKRFTTSGNTDACRGISLSSDGRSLCAYDPRGAMFYDCASGKKLSTLFTPQGRTLVKVFYSPAEDVFGVIEAEGRALYLLRVPAGGDAEPGTPAPLGPEWNCDMYGNPPEPVHRGALLFREGKLAATAYAGEELGLTPEAAGKGYSIIGNEVWWQQDNSLYSRNLKTGKTELRITVEGASNLAPLSPACIVCYPEDRGTPYLVDAAGRKLSDKFEWRFERYGAMLSFWKQENPSGTTIVVNTVTGKAYSFVDVPITGFGDIGFVANGPHSSDGLVGVFAPPVVPLPEDLRQVVGWMK